MRRDPHDWADLCAEDFDDATRNDDLESGRDVAAHPEIRSGEPSAGIDEPATSGPAESAAFNTLTHLAALPAAGNTPTTGPSLARSGVDGAPRHESTAATVGGVGADYFATPDPNPVTRDGRSAAASAPHDLGGRAVPNLPRNPLACRCGAVQNPAHPFGYCPGGRDCLDRIVNLHENEKGAAAATNDAAPMAA